MSDGGQPQIFVRADFERVPADILAAVADMPTGNVGDSNDRSSALAPMFRSILPGTRCVGSALTVLTAPRDNLAPYVALTHARPGDVLVIATGGCADGAILGDIAVGLAKNAGIVGIVTDGMVRDADGLQEVGVPVFAQGLNPNGPTKLGPGTVGLPVVLANRPVESGDLVVADDDGVVIIPRRQFDALRKGVPMTVAKEAGFAKTVESGATQHDWLAEVLAGPGIVRL